MIDEINKELLDIISHAIKKDVSHVSMINEATPCGEAKQTFVMRIKDSDEEIHVNMFEFAHRCKVVAVSEFQWHIYSSVDGGVELIDRYGISDERNNGLKSGIEVLSVIRALKWIKEFEKERKGFESQYNDVVSNNDG